MNILFITANRLGDAVLSMGVLAALIRRHPTARITVACGAMVAPLFTDIPHVARVIVMIKQPRHGHWRELWLQTVGTSWDLIVDLRNTLVSRLLRRRSLKAFRGPKPGQHMVESFAALMGLDVLEVAPRLWLDTSAVDQLSAVISPDAPLLALAPGSNAFGKRWPSDRFAALADRLTAVDGILAGGMVAILGAPEERRDAEPIVGALPPDRTIDLVGHTNPLQAAAWLARADLYIGNDSGLSHLAAAAGAPTLVLFGPSIPARYRPWGRKTAYLIAEEDPARTIDLCKIDDMLARKEMEKLSVDYVLKTAEAFYRRMHPSDG